MSIQHVDGKDKGSILLYALSTCIWCRKTKRLLNDLQVAYDYMDVDLLNESETEKVKEEMKRWNPKCSFPTLVLNERRCVIGFEEKEIREVLGNAK